MERIIELNEIEPGIFYGVNNTNLQLIKILFPKLRIVGRGNIIKVSGDLQEIAVFEEKMRELEKFCAKYNHLGEDEVREIITANKPKIHQPDHTIIFGVNGKPIVARTANQQKLYDDYAKNDLLFAVGPAGSGKTYTAIALAVRALKNREIKRIILSRPAVEAGESLGFLPGDLKEKIDPYLQPLYDALKDMIPGSRLQEFMENETIHIAPLAYMRGRTLNDAVVILDEAQNTTRNQLKMFLTRMGVNTKFIVTGDDTQVDLPRKSMSGLIHAMQILRNIKGISIIQFDVKDIVRHRLVQEIVKAYDIDSERQEFANNEKQPEKKKV